MAIDIQEQAHFSKLPRSQQLYMILKAIDPANTMTQAHFESLTRDQQLFQLLQVAEGPFSADIAYLSETGSSTPAIGDPKNPYSTIQAAYNAGARYFIMGVGDFGDLNITSDSVLWIVGYGSWKDYEGDGALPASKIGTITVNGNGLLVQDVHGYSVWINAVSSIASNGAAGGTDQSGSDGSGTGTMGFRMCEIGSITVRGGNGGNGGVPDTLTGTNGGNGGSAGYLALDATRVSGAILIEGGNGGTPQGDGVGGNGGDATGGEISHDTVTSNINANGGDGDGTGGTGGGGGDFIVANSKVGVIDLDGGGGAVAGANGDLTATFTSLSTPTNTGTYTRRAVVQGGTFFAS